MLVRRAGQRFYYVFKRCDEELSVLTGPPFLYVILHPWGDIPSVTISMLGGRNGHGGSQLRRSIASRWCEACDGPHHEGNIPQVNPWLTRDALP